MALTPSATTPAPPEIERTGFRTDAAVTAANRGTPVLDVVIPVHNEQSDLHASISRLHAYLSRHFPYRFRITIADNASTDATASIGASMATALTEVTFLRLERKGRGHALHEAWSTSDAPVLAYMDVDLSTGLAALLPLVAPLISGHSDVAIGTRLARGAHVTRGAKRELISRCYNLLLRGTLAIRFSDAQCGFKAVRADVAQRLLQLVTDTGWFFDTELLVVAERTGLRIHEVAVDWVDDPHSTVDIVATALGDLRGITRLFRALVTGALPVRELANQLGRTPVASGAVPVPRGLLRQLVRFSAVGAISTIAYLALFLLLRGGVGAQAANLLALLITAIANTAANRHFTFGVRGRVALRRHQFEGLLVFGLGLAVTSGSLAILHASTDAGRSTEAIVLVCANLVATLLRFLLLRGWVFHPDRSHNS